MPSRNEEVYQIKNKRLLLIDRELDLEVDLPFDPILLPLDPTWGQELDCGHYIAGNISRTEFFVEKNGLPNGQCRLYDQNQKTKGEMYYTDGLLHGPSTFFNASGQVLSTAWFIHGKCEGKCLWYYFDGQLYSRQRFKNGLPHGKQEYFFRDGAMKTIITYQNGEIEEVLA